MYMLTSNWLANHTSPAFKFCVQVLRRLQPTLFTYSRSITFSRRNVILSSFSNLLLRFNLYNHLFKIIIPLNKLQCGVGFHLILEVEDIVAGEESSQGSGKVSEVSSSWDYNPPLN